MTKRSADPHQEAHATFEEHPSVRWAEQQKVKGRNINCMLGAMLAKSNFINLELTLLLIFYLEDTSSRAFNIIQTLKLMG